MALLVMHFDIVPVDGAWREPCQDARDSTTQLIAPIDLPVRMIPRVNPQEGLWELTED
jgi:hypothetical protein